jgi:hypothetical protein
MQRHMMQRMPSSFILRTYCARTVQHYRVGTRIMGVRGGASMRMGAAPPSSTKLRTLAAWPSENMAM